MSKKDKSKFRRRLRAEILKQMSATSRAEGPSTPEETMARPEAKTETPAVETPASASISADTLQLVRLDLKKSAIIIGSIIILIIALYLIDLRTDILLDISEKIF